MYGYEMSEREDLQEDDMCSDKKEMYKMITSDQSDNFGSQNVTISYLRVCISFFFRFNRCVYLSGTARGRTGISYTELSVAYTFREGFCLVLSSGQKIDTYRIP